MPSRVATAGTERPEALPEGVPRAGKVLRHRGFGGKLGFRRACAWGRVGGGLGVVLVGELGFWPLLGPSRPPISPQSPPQGPPITPQACPLWPPGARSGAARPCRCKRGLVAPQIAPLGGVSHAHVALFGSCLVVLCAFIREGLHMRMPILRRKCGGWAPNLRTGAHRGPPGRRPGPHGRPCVRLGAGWGMVG